MSILIKEKATLYCSSDVCFNNLAREHQLYKEEEINQKRDTILADRPYNFRADEADDHAEYRLLVSFIMKDLEKGSGRLDESGSACARLLVHAEKPFGTEHLPLKTQRRASQYQAGFWRGGLESKVVEMWAEVDVENTVLHCIRTIESYR